MTGRAIYLKAHPFLLAFAAAMAITGILVLFLPDVRSTSLTLVDLPGWIAFFWAAMCIGGGGACAYGVWTCQARWEGAGTTALATTQLFSVATAVAALGWETALLGTIKNLGLASGLLIRAVILARQP